MVQGIGQFRASGFADGPDARPQGVVIIPGDTPGLPAAANGATVTRLTPGLWGPISGTRSTQYSTKGRPNSPVLREIRRLEAIDAARGRPTVVPGTWSADLERDPATIAGRWPYRSDADGYDDARYSTVYTPDTAEPRAPRPTDALRALLDGQVDAVTVRSAPGGTPVQLTTAPADARIPFSQGASTGVIRLGGATEAGLREYLAQSEPAATRRGNAALADPELKGQIMEQIRSIARDLSSDLAARGADVPYGQLIPEAERIFREQQGERFPIDPQTGLPSDIPVWSRGKAGADRAEMAAMNADPSGFSSTDPATADFRPKSSAALNPYGSVTLPVVGADGQISGYREIYPSDIAESRVLNADATFASDTFQEVPIGRLAQEANQASKTPVITGVALEDAIRAGRYRPFPYAERQGNMVGLLFRNSGEVIGPETLAALDGNLRRDAGDLTGGDPIAAAAVGSGLSGLKGRRVDPRVGALVAFGADGRPAARLTPEVRDGVYTGNLVQELAQPIYATESTTTELRAIPYADRQPNGPEAAEVTTELYRIGQPMNRDPERQRDPELARAVGVQQVMAPATDPGRLVGLAKLRSAIEDQGLQVVVPGSGETLGLPQLQERLQALRGQSSSQLNPAQPFFDVTTADGRVLQRLAYAKDPGGRYTGQLVPMVQREVGPSPFIGALGGAGLSDRDSGAMTNTRIRAERAVAAKPTAAELEADAPRLRAIAGLEQAVNALGSGAFMAPPSAVDGIKQVIVPKLLSGELSADQVAGLFPAGSHGRTMLRQAVFDASRGQAQLDFLDEGPRMEMRRFEQSPNQWFQQGDVPAPIRTDRPAPERTEQMAANERALAQQIFSPAAVRQLTVPGTEGPMPAAPNVVDEIDAYMASRPRQIRDRTVQPVTQGELFALPPRRPYYR